MATLKDGSFNDGVVTFNGGARLTTTDALQIQNKYCKMKDNNFILKEHLMCGGTDAVGLNRPVFVDRYCDNSFDCANGSDEDGSVIQCDVGQLTENGCCETYLIYDQEFVYGGIHQGRDYFNNTNSNSFIKHLVFISGYVGDWFKVATPIDQLSNGFSHYGYAISNATCPPINATWSRGTAPRCKSMGRIITDHCAQSNCHADADCTNNLESFTCTCKYGYVGDGVNCEALPIEDECSTGNNLCDQVGGECTDTAFGYTCECGSGFWDQNPESPGRECEFCCQTLDLVEKNSDTIWNSCKLNTDMELYGDKWVYECSNGIQLQYLAWGSWHDWVIVKWLENGRFNWYDRTTEMGSDDNAEGSCFPPSLTFESSYDAVCTSRVDHCAQNNCHTNAECTNTLDTFVCSCKTGFGGDGVNNCDALPVEDECAIGNNDCDSIGGVCTDTEYSYTCSCDTGFWDANPDNPGRQCDGCCETVDIVHKNGNSVWTSCTINTTAVSQGGDKWYYECDNDYQLEYLDWSEWKNWVILRWAADGSSISYTDKTTEMGSDAHAEGKCFPSSITFESKYDAVCTSRVGYCSQNNCHENAECTNTLDSFICSCKTGYDGDGVNHCDALPVEDECALGNNECDPIGGVCTDTQFSYTCSCDTGFWDVNPDNPGRNCDGCCETVDIVYKNSNSVWTSCTINTTAVSQGGDKWVYECDNDLQLEYLDCKFRCDWNKWAILRWTAEGSISWYDRTAEMESDVPAEGRCFPPSISFENNYDAVCTSRVDDNMTTPAPITISTQASSTSTKAPVSTSTQVALNSTEITVATSYKAPLATPTQASTMSTEELYTTEALTITSTAESKRDVTAQTTNTIAKPTGSSTNQAVETTAQSTAGSTTKAINTTVKPTAVPRTQTVDTTAKSSESPITQAVYTATTPTTQTADYKAESTDAQTTQAFDTRSQAETSAAGTKRVTVSGSLATSVDWNDDLNDPSSEFYASTSASAKADLQYLLTQSSDVQSASVEIIEFERVSARRKRRQTSSSKTTVNYEANVSVQEGKSTNEIKNSIMSAFENADPSEFSIFDSFDDISLDIYEQNEAFHESTTVNSASEASSRSSTEQPAESTEAPTVAPVESTETPTVVRTDAPLESTDASTEPVAGSTETPTVPPGEPTEVLTESTEILQETSESEIPEVTTPEPIQEITTTKLVLEVTTADIVPQITTFNSIPKVTTTEFVPDITTTDILPKFTTANPVPDVTTANQVPYSTTADLIPDVLTNDFFPDNTTADVFPKTEVTSTFSSPEASTTISKTEVTATFPTSGTSTSIMITGATGVSTVEVITEATKFAMTTGSQVANVTEYQTEILTSSVSDDGHQTTSEPTTVVNSLTTVSNVLIFSESELEILTERLNEKESVVASQFEHLDQIELNVDDIEKRLDIMRNIIVTTTTTTTTTVTTTSFISTTTVEPCDQTISSCGSWSDWSSISSCSVTCGKGVETWERCFAFTDDIDQKCESETRTCLNKPCPGWAKWSIWGPCSATCRESGKSSPTQERYRCWDTKSRVGVDCGSEEGDNDHFQSQSRECNSDDYCQLECEWQDWGEWSDCNPECVEGIKLRRRTNNENQGASCDPNDPSVESQICSDNPNQCESCYNLYDKCDRIPTSFCTDFRYKSKVRHFNHR